MLTGTLLMAAMLAIPTSASAVQTSVTLWLILDPHAENRLEIETPGVPVGTELVGGVLTTLRFDPAKLLLNRRLSADVEIDEIRIAGASFVPVPAFPTLQTGTICVTADPSTPSGGTLTLPVLALPRIAADMRTLTFLTSPLGTIFPDGIPLTARVEDDLEVDLRALLLNLTAGPVAVDTEASGVIPPDILFLGGLPFSLRVKIVNSLLPPAHPLLDECAAFLAAR
jgi:hypothetical protein